MSPRSRRFAAVTAFALAAVLPFGALRAQEARALAEKLAAIREAAADRDLEQTERLVAEFDAMAPGDDSRDEARLLLGKTRLAHGRLAEATDAVRAVVDRTASPWSVKALYLTAESAARRREWTHVADVYAAQVDSAMSDAHAAEIAALYREIADGAFEGDVVRDEFGRESRRPDWAAALAYYTKARAAFPGAKDAALVSYRTGRAAFESGDALAARAEWTALREKGAGEWADDALFGIGLAERRLGRQAEARAAFAKVIEEAADGPFAPLALIETGASWLDAPRGSDDLLARAVASWREFLRLHPRHERAPEVAWRIGAEFADRSKLRDAAEAFREYVRTWPDRPETPSAQDRIAQCHLALGEHDRAVAEWRVLLEKWPNHELWPKAQASVVAAEFAKASSAFDEKRDADAKAAADAFLARYPADPNAPNAMRILAEIHVRAGRHAEAVEAFRLVTTKFPQSPAAPDCALRIAAEHEGPLADLDRALAAYEEVVAKWPTSKAATDARSVLAQMKGRTLRIDVPRAFRTDEAAAVKVVVRNVPKLRMKAYRVRLDEYCRRKGGLAGVESVEVDVVKPDHEWDWSPQDFAKYRLLERECPLPLPKPGAFVVTAADEELTATFLVVVSDLTVVAKSAQGQALVFVIDERTGDPVRGARVSLLGESAAGMTGEDGVWRSDAPRGGPIRAVVSGDGPHAGHFAFATGESGTATAFGYATKVHLATDRPVYRPGQTVTLRGIVRRVADGRYVAEKSLPVAVRVTDPRGARLFTGVVETDEFGMLQRTVDLADEPTLGTYSLQADLDGRTFTQTFDVLAYRKPDVLAEVETERRTYLAGDRVRATFSLRYAVGGHVASAPVRWSVRRGPFTFDASVHEAFAWFFRDAARDAALAARRAESSELVTSGEGVTDADGRFVAEFATDAGAGDRTYVLDVEAQDPNRRWIAASSSVPVTTQGVHVVCRTEKKVARPGEAIPLEVLTVDPLHVPLAAEGRAVLVRRRLDGQHFVDDEVASVPAVTGPDGRTVVELRAQKAGEHRLRFVTKDVRGAEVSGETTVTVSGDAEDFSKQVRLIADREFYREGDVAKVFVNVPAAPTSVLFTWEGERVIEHRVLRVTERATTIDVPLRAEHAPNVFLRIAAARGGNLYEDGDEVAVFQYLDVRVAADPADARPGTKVKLRVTASDQSGRPVRAEVGVDVVDAAILQIAPDGTPQVKPFFYDQRRRHGVNTCASVGALPSVTRATNKDLLFEQMRRLGKAQFEQMQEHVRAGRRHLEGGDVVKAAEELRKALDIAPGNYEARSLLDSLREQEKQTADRAASKAPRPAARPPGAPAPEKSKGDMPQADEDSVVFGAGGGAGGAYGGRRGGTRTLRAGGGGKNSADGSGSADDPVLKDAKFAEDSNEDVLAVTNASGAPASSARFRRVFADMSGSVADSAADVPAELRERFADTAHAALVRTGDDGAAVVEIDLPDNLTEWKVAARGATTGPLVGEGATTFRASKPLLVRPDAPRFLVEGDRTTPTATVHSSLPAETDVTVKFGAELLVAGGETERRVTVRPGEVRPFDGRLDAPAHGLGSMRVDALSPLASDAARLAVPVVPYGMPRADGASGRIVEEAFADLELPERAVPGATRCTVTVAPSIDTALFEAMAWNGSFPYGCVEQTVNRFWPALAVRMALGETGSSAARVQRVLDATVVRGLAALYAMQRDDGSFGWFGPRAGGGSGADTEMTAYAILAMSDAASLGFPVSQPNFENAVAAGRRAAGRGAAEERALLLFALSRAGAIEAEPLVALQREQAALRPRSLALLALAMQRSGRGTNAAELVRRLETTAVRANGLAHWEGDSTFVRDGRIVRPVPDAEPTAWALLAILGSDPRNPLADEAFAWLAQSRRGPAWRSTRDTAAAIAAMAAYASSHGIAAAQGEVSVFVNGAAEPAATIVLSEGGRAIDAPRTAQIPEALLRAGTNRIALRRRGGGAALWSARLASVERPGEGRAMEPGGVLLSLRREYTEWHRPLLPGETREARIVPGWTVVVPEKRPVWNGRSVRTAGTSDKIQVTLTVAAPERARNLLVEDRLPAGFEVVAGSAEGPFDREERRDDRQCFFVANPAQGATFTYVLQAIHPGEYRALPATAELMYEPEIRAWTGEDRLAVVPEPGAAYRSPSAEEITPDEVFGRALRAFARKDWSESRRGLEALRDSFALTPETLEELWARLFRIGIESKDAKLTVAAWQEMTSRNPRRAPTDRVTRRALAEALRTTGDAEVAAGQLRDLVRDVFADDVEAARAFESAGNPWRTRDLLVAGLSRMPDTGWTEEAELQLAQRTAALRAPVPASVAGRAPTASAAQPLLLDESVRMLRRFQAHHAESGLAHEAGALAVRTLVQAGLGADAVREGTRFLSRHPQSRHLDDVTLLVAQGSFQAGEHDRALEAAQALLTRKFPSDGDPSVLVESPHRAQAIHLAAKIAHLRGDLARAADLYRQVEGLFPDAADSVRFLTEAGLRLREVESVPLGTQPVLHLSRKNVPEAALDVYAVDFMILYAVRRDLSQVNRIDLSGIEPVKRWTVARRGAEDFRWHDEEVELPAKEKGVYLVTARAGDLFASSVVIVSDLQVDVQRTGDRVRIYTSRRAAGAPWGEVYVKVGDGNRILAQGFTDARGVLEVQAPQAAAFSVVAESDGHVALWRP